MEKENSQNPEQTPTPSASWTDAAAKMASTVITEAVKHPLTTTASVVKASTRAIFHPQETLSSLVSMATPHIQSATKKILGLSADSFNNNALTDVLSHCFNGSLSNNKIFSIGCGNTTNNYYSSGVQGAAPISEGMLKMATELAARQIIDLKQNDQLDQKAVQAIIENMHQNLALTAATQLPAIEASKQAQQTKDMGRNR